MVHQLNVIDGAMIIRLHGQTSAHEIYQAGLAVLEKQVEPVHVILDLTTATVFDQQHKAIFYRLFQHSKVKMVVGICGIHQTLAKDVNDLIVALSRVRRIMIRPTEIDARTALGLTAPLAEQRQLSGMLSYLKKS